MSPDDTVRGSRSSRPRQLSPDAPNPDDLCVSLRRRPSHGTSTDSAGRRRCPAGPASQVDLDRHPYELLNAPFASSCPCPGPGGQRRQRAQPAGRHRGRSPGGRSLGAPGGLSIRARPRRSRPGLASLAQFSAATCLACWPPGARSSTPAPSLLGPRSRLKGPIGH